MNTNQNIIRPYECSCKYLAFMEVKCIAYNRHYAL